MNRLYGDRVIFAFVYTREAHPGGNVRQPVTLEEKVEHAHLLQEIHSVDWPVLVDDLDGTLHRALDTKQELRSHLPIGRNADLPGAVRR